eukprot:scaffold25814_cov76-Skeletonema_marinoi.AAC.1
MAKVSLGSGSGNKSSRAKRVETSENSLQLSSAAVLDYTMGACPPVGYGTNKISVSTSNDELLSILQKAIKTFAKQGDNNIDPTTYKVLSKNTLLLETVASSSHSLKSVQSILIEENSTKLVDTAKKCLKALSSMTDGKSKTNNSSTNKKNGHVGVVLEYALLCLGSYEGLGKLLHNNSSKKKKVGIGWDEMLPIPKIGETYSKSTTPLPQKQLVKIALESSQCAASSLLYLSLISLHVSTTKSKDEWMIRNMLHALG